jgi:hypothetical protein
MPFPDELLTPEVAKWAERHGGLRAVLKAKVQLDYGW